jgi:hypothetical protein
MKIEIDSKVFVSKFGANSYPNLGTRNLQFTNPCESEWHSKILKFCRKLISLKL